MQALKLLDKAKLTGIHYKILVIGSLIYMLTAMNVMLIGSVVTPIITEWGLDKALRGPIFSIGFLGMFVGAIVFGRVADIIGRRPTLIIVILIEAIFTALHALAADLNTLYLLRFLAGVGLGAALPQPGIYVSEYTPKEYRGRFLGLVETSWVYGALLALIFPYVIIPNYGWRAAFIVGLLPLLLLPFVIKYMPESIRYLLKKGRKEEAKSILNSIGFETTAMEVEELETKFNIWDLFSRRYISRTILLTILWMSLVYTYYAIFLWLPTIYATSFGMSVLKSLFWTLVVTIFQIPGYYSATFLLDRIGRKKVLAIYLVLAGIASLLMSVSTSLQWFQIWTAAISFFNLGAWAGLYTYTPELYPTEIRGVASGFAASMGRVAGIISPIVTAMLYASYGLLGPYALTSAVHVLAGISVVLLGIETMRKSLEELE